MRTLLLVVACLACGCSDGSAGKIAQLQAENAELRESAFRPGLSCKRSDIQAMFPVIKWSYDAEKGMCSGVHPCGSHIMLWGTEDRLDCVTLIGGLADINKATLLVSLTYKLSGDWDAEKMKIWYSKAMAVSLNDINASCVHNGVRVMVVGVPISDPPVFCVSFEPHQSYIPLAD